ncbi:hypothetical protein NZK33_20100 [Cyanobium sp. FGCU-6]|nr:hypothetical protein [Cyanobium sp. FGCU6]
MESTPSAPIQAESSPEARTLTTNSTSAAVREQLILALELDLVGHTPGLLAQLEAEGQSQVGLHSKGAKQAAKAAAADGERRGRPPKARQLGETEPSHTEQMGLGL